MRLILNDVLYKQQFNARGKVFEITQKTISFSIQRTALQCSWPAEWLKDIMAALDILFINQKIGGYGYPPMPEWALKKESQSPQKLTADKAQFELDGLAAFGKAHPHFIEEVNKLEAHCQAGSEIVVAIGCPWEVGVDSDDKYAAYLCFYRRLSVGVIPKGAVDPALLERGWADCRGAFGWDGGKGVTSMPCDGKKKGKGKGKGKK